MSDSENPSDDNPILRSRFEKAVDYVLKHEGGYVNNHFDAGGETNFGISHQWLSSISNESLSHKAIHDLTQDDAKYLYRVYFWEKGLFDKITNDALAIKAFDFAVNAGISRSIKLLQRAFNALYPKRMLIVDGIIGKDTLNALNAIPQDSFYSSFTKEIIYYYNELVKIRPQNTEFLEGWLRRANDRIE